MERENLFFSVSGNCIRISPKGHTSFQMKSPPREITLSSEIYFRFFEISEQSEKQALALEQAAGNIDLDLFYNLLFLDSEDVRIPSELPLSWDEVSNTEQERDLFIFFGGGIDSSALAAIFPEARKITLFDAKDPPFSLDPGDIFIETNLKTSAFEPKGWTCWTQPFSIAVILNALFQTQKQNTYLLGTILGASSLQNGKGYFDRESRSQKSTFGLTANAYLSYILASGIQLFAPLAAVSELITAKICAASDDIPSFCQNENNSNCLRCPKCLRKTAELSFWNTRFLEYFRTSVSRTPTTTDFRFFEHLWVFLGANSEEIHKLLLGTFNTYRELNFKDPIDLQIVYSHILNYFAPPDLAESFIARLSRFGVFEADVEQTEQLLAYKK